MFVQNGSLPLSLSLDENPGGDDFLVANHFYWILLLSGINQCGVKLRNLWKLSNPEQRFKLSKMGPSLCPSRLTICINKITPARQNFRTVLYPPSKNIPPLPKDAISTLHNRFTVLQWYVCSRDFFFTVANWILQWPYLQVLYLQRIILNFVIIQ